MANKFQSTIDDVYINTTSNIWYGLYILVIDENEYVNSFNDVNVDCNYTCNIGQVISSSNITYSLCIKLNSDLIYKNTNNIKIDNQYINGLLLYSDNNINYDIMNNIIYNYQYKNTLLNIVNSNNIYESSRYIISDILYNNDIVTFITNNINYFNMLITLLDSDIIYFNTYYVTNNIQYNIDVYSNVTSNYSYSNLLSSILDNTVEYSNGLEVSNIFTYNNTIDIELISNNQYVNNLTSFISTGIQISYDLLDKNIIVSDNNITYYLGVDGSIYTENSITGYINNQLIDIINCSFNIDEDSFSYSFSAEVATLQDWFLCVPNNEIIIILNTNIYKFIIDSRSRAREFNSDRYTFEARSKTAILDKNVVTKTYESVFVSDVIQELCNANNINYSYDLLNWNLPSGLLTADKESPISIMQRLVSACGGIIICDNLGDLQFKTKYLTSPLLYTSNVDSFNDYNNIFNVSELSEINDKWNAVIVSNISESNDYSYSISEIDDLENDIYTKHLRLKVFPYLTQIDLLTSFISNDILIKNYDNPITETIENEIIEIVEGKGSSSESIKQIISYSYLNADLGTLLFNNNEITTQIYGQSLIKITYKTEYHDFILYNGLQTSDIQVYTTDEYEVI